MNYFNKQNITVFSILLLAIFLSFPQLLQAQFTHKRVLRLMGSKFEIVGIHQDSSLAQQGVNEAINEIIRIENLISSWKPTSQTAKINQNAGKDFITIKKELYQLINRSKKISTLTNGAFDISFASIDPLWKFDGSMSELPDSLSIIQSVAYIDFHKIILHPTETSIRLEHGNMKIGFGAIGKGYAANQAKKVMQSLGIENGLVNAGGDLTAWGRPQDGTNWKIGIANPNDKTNALAWLTLRNQAVVTSGNYEKYVEFDGKRYSHIINPKTGYPVQGIKSVTIVCPDTEFADALATAVFVLGIKNGLALINQLKGVESLIIDDENILHTSSNLVLDKQSPQN